MSLLSGSVQPSLMTLFSSTSIPWPSPLITSHLDKTYPERSLIQVLPDHTSSSSMVAHNEQRGSLQHQVVHIQSPDISKTYIQAGCSKSECQRRLEKGKLKDGEVLPLGVELGWVGMHIKRLGRRDLAVEVGVVDARGREGAIRVSSFKKEPTIHLDRDVPLLHLPLTLPTRTASTMTSWLHISVDLHTLLPLFERLPRRQPGPGLVGQAKKRKLVTEVPSGRFGSISYVRVYANCRVRRIWFAEDGERSLEGMDLGGREEWGLYASETI